MSARLKIVLLDVAWWVLLPIAWPAWAICCVYNRIGTRRVELVAQLEREKSRPVLCPKCSMFVGSTTEAGAGGLVCPYCGERFDWSVKRQ